MQMTKTIGAMALVATAMTGVMASPAEAHWKRKNHYHESSYDNDDYYERRGYRDRRDDRRYSYRGCDRGNGGTAIGAVVGGVSDAVVVDVRCRAQVDAAMEVGDPPECRCPQR